MTQPKDIDPNKIQRFDLFCFRKPLLVEGGGESNLFFKSDIRSIFANTLDGNMARVSKDAMMRAIKLPFIEVTSLKAISDLFQGEEIKSFDLRSSDYPCELLILGGDSPKLHTAYSDNPSLAVGMKAFVDKHNAAIKAQKAIDIVDAPTIDKEGSFNVANCF
jgi:hypothetical protein